MSKTDKKPTKTEQELTTTIESMVSAAISEKIGTILSALEMKEKVIFSTLSTIQNSINLLEKQFSYKLGAIQAAQSKQKAKGIEFDDPQEALAYAQFLQQHTKTIPNIEDQSEPHPLSDK